MAQIVRTDDASLQLGSLLESFRQAMVTILPIMDEVGIRWKQHEAYDDWDRIEDALFSSIVLSSITQRLNLETPPKFVRYAGNDFDDPYSSFLYDLDLGKSFPFSYLVSSSGLFDVAHFVPTSTSSLDHSVQKNLNECRFAAHMV